LDELAPVGVDRRAAAGERARTLLVEVADADDLGAVQPLQDGDVLLRDPPRPDDADAHGATLLPVAQLVRSSRVQGLARARPWTRLEVLWLLRSCASKDASRSSPAGAPDSGARSRCASPTRVRASSSATSCASRAREARRPRRGSASAASAFRRTRPVGATSIGSRRPRARPCPRSPRVSPPP